MSNVTFVVNDDRSEASSLAATATMHLASLGHDSAVVSIAELDQGHPARCDLLVSLGGDGTFLAAAAVAHRLEVPILGVNFGRLGYLLALQPSDLLSVLEEGIRDGFATEARSVLHVESHPAAGGLPVAYLAINEVAVEKPHPGHMVHLATAIDGEPFQRYAADGVVVATATGSTAYNLSAGGPVLAPELDVMVLTPVAPHLSVDRSVVLGRDHRIEVTVTGGRSAVVVIDGRQVAALDPGSKVTCTLGSRPLRLVAARDQVFVGRLRSILSPAGSD